MLAFCLPDTRLNDQSGVVGLVQAMLAFSSIFSQVWFSFQTYTTYNLQFILYYDETAEVCNQRLIVHLQEIPCEAMHAEHSRWILQQPEPHIWLLVVRKSAICGLSIGLSKSRLVTE